MPDKVCSALRSVACFATELYVFCNESDERRLRAIQLERAIQQAARVRRQRADDLIARSKRYKKSKARHLESDNPVRTCEDAFRSLTEGPNVRETDRDTVNGVKKIVRQVPPEGAITFRSRGTKSPYPTVDINLPGIGYVKIECV